MADIFARLARRAHEPVPGIVPRVAARFEPSTDAGEAVGGSGAASGWRDPADVRDGVDEALAGFIPGEHPPGQPPAAARPPRGPGPGLPADRRPGGTGPGPAGSAWPGETAGSGRPQGARSGGSGSGPEGSAGLGEYGPGGGTRYGGTRPGQGARLGDGDRLGEAGEAARAGEGGQPGVATTAGRMPETGLGMPAAAATGVGRAVRPQPPRSGARRAGPAAPTRRVSGEPQVKIRPVPQAPATDAATGGGTPRTVQISIGRIVVRATPPPAAPLPAPAPPPAGLTLSAYLHGDDGRPR